MFIHVLPHFTLTVYLHILVAEEQLNVNLTSSLIHILQITHTSWTKDLQQNHQTSSNSPSSLIQADFIHNHRRTTSGKVIGEGSEGVGKKVSTMERGLALLHSVRFVSTTRQRTKFVPFLLRNNTGLPLKFTTLTSVPSKVTDFLPFWLLIYIKKIITVC